MNTYESKHNTGPLVYEVQLNLLPGLKGMLSSDEVLGTICVSVPHELGGPKRSWNPEHLFLGAMSSSFMATLLSFSQEIDLTELQCDVIGRIQFVDGSYAFTGIDMLPTIRVASMDQKEKAEAVLLKAKQHCLIVNTVKCHVFFHSQVLIEIPKEADNIAEHASLYI